MCGATVGDGAVPAYIPFPEAADTCEILNTANQSCRCSALRHANAGIATVLIGDGDTDMWSTAVFTHSAAGDCHPDIVYCMGVAGVSKFSQSLC